MRIPVLLLTWLGLAAGITFFACKKEAVRETPNDSVNLASIKAAFFSGNYASSLTSKFNDSLKIEWLPNWDHLNMSKETDSTTIYYIPLEAKLYCEKSNRPYLVEVKDASKILLVREVHSNFDFQVATYLNPPAYFSEKNAKSQKQGGAAPAHKIFVDDFRGHISSTSYRKTLTGYEKIDNISNAQRSTKVGADAGTLDIICYYVCTWGYYCHGGGYTVTYTVSQGSCQAPSPPGQRCPTTSYGFDDLNNQLWPHWTLGNTEERCISGPPSTLPVPNMDPSIFPPLGGSYNSAAHTPDLSPIPEVTNNYLFICLDNFTFKSVTENDLWQESTITNIYCNVVKVGFPNVSRRVTIPKLTFGVAYYNANGKLIYTSLDAMTMSRDALNWGEYRMCKKFYNNPNFTESQLADIWITEANNMMNTLSKGLGKVSKLASMNPVQPVVSRAYVPCN